MNHPPLPNSRGNQSTFNDQVVVCLKDLSKRIESTNNPATVKVYPAAPGSPRPGDIYFDSTSNHFYGFNGVEYKQLDN